MDWFFTFNFKMSRKIDQELSLAVMNGEISKVSDLLSSGADVNVMMKDHSTLLHLATTPEVTETLLLNGANVNAVNQEGESALHVAVRKVRRLSIVDVLLKHGADINLKNDFGQTPLHCAVTDREGLLLVRKLLRNGANVNETDNKRNSVLFLVVKYYKNLEILKELLEFDADILVRSSSLYRFFTPIDVAIHEGDISTLQMLIKITVLKNYEKDFRKISDLQSYIQFNNNNEELSCFLDECVSEISYMNIDMVNKKYSLFDYIKICGNIKPLYAGNVELVVSRADKYKIYKDINRHNLRPCIQRGNLLDKLKSSQVSFELPYITGGSALSKYALLNGDCLFKIGELLCNDDLLNFLVGIDDNVNPCDYSLHRYLSEKN